MNIRGIGCDSVCGSGGICYKPEKGTYLFIIAKNRIRFRMGEKETAYPDGTAVILDDKDSFEFFPEGKALVYDWICFDAEGDGDLMESFEAVLNRPVCYTDSEFIFPLIRNIMAEYYSLETRRVKMLDNLMRILLMKLSESGLCHEEKAVHTAVPHYSMLVELREKIYRNPQQKWNVDTMAADVNMSRSYFQHVYREVFGVSCISDVISGKIEKAKEILNETNCTVSQVAAMCGYDNEEHFMRQFKKIVGVTPTKYRKQL
ncbi:MAG: helix-turn-helix transcriptional regulator [Ruminococcus sp.]|nr:helix-turn-helix transcriptional regulator [Ruminococcus sp.]